MKVIKHGNTYREVECKNCGALLSYCEHEVTIESHWVDCFGEWKDFYKEYIICPECKKDIVFSFIVDGEETVK